jgi:hypothetical protein
MLYASDLSGEFKRTRVPPIWVFSERLSYYGAEPLGNSGGLLAVQWRRIMQMFHDRSYRGIAAKGDMPCEHLVHHDPNGVDVAPEIHTGAARLLGAHEFRRAQNVAGDCLAGNTMANLFGDAEIHQPDGAGTVHHDVGRL